MEHSPYNSMVGVSFHFTQMVAPVFLILAVLYVGQPPWKKGIIEIRSPLAPPQEDPFFSNAPLLGCYPTHKVPVENLLCIWRKHYLAEFLLGKQAFHFFSQ